MKIAYVLLDGEVTGGQVVARQLMRAAREAGHAALAIAPREGPMLDALREEGFEVHLLPLSRSFRIDQAGRLASLFRERRVDLVDTHTLFVGNQLARLAAALAAVPLVAHAHIDEPFSSRRGVAALQRRVDAATAPLCAVTVAVSHEIRRTLVSMGVPKDRVVVIHNGVPVEEVLHREQDAVLRVICIGRLAPIKGQAVLLRALALAGPGVEVAFAGEDLEGGGAYRHELERLAADLEVADRVRFLGYQSDVKALLDDADALVLPSLLEGFPLVVLEAMERGRAVVATAVGGTPELVVDGTTGLLVPPDTPEPLARTLGRLRDDLDLRRRLGSEGRSRVEHFFTVERTGERTIAVYESVAGSRGKL